MCRSQLFGSPAVPPRPTAEIGEPCRYLLGRRAGDWRSPAGTSRPPTAACGGFLGEGFLGRGVPRGAHVPPVPSRCGPALRPLLVRGRPRITLSRDGLGVGNVCCRCGSIERISCMSKWANVGTVPAANRGWMGSSRLFQPGSTLFSVYLPWRSAATSTTTSMPRTGSPFRPSCAILSQGASSSRCSAMPALHRDLVDGGVQRPRRAAARRHQSAVGRLCAARALPQRLLQRGRARRGGTRDGARQAARAGGAEPGGRRDRRGQPLEVWDREAWLTHSSDLLNTVNDIGPGSPNGHTA